MLIEKTLASGMRVWHARPDTEEPRPLMLMLHERYGPVKHSFNVIGRIAEAGFVACFMDMFHRYEGDRAPIEKSEARVDPTDEESIADLDETETDTQQDDAGAQDANQAEAHPRLKACRQTHGVADQDPEQDRHHDGADRAFWQPHPGYADQLRQVPAPEGQAKSKHKSGQYPHNDYLIVFAATPRSVLGINGRVPQ